MKIMANVFLMFVLGLFVFYPINLKNITYAETQMQTSAKAMVVLDSASNRVLYGKNIDEKLPMASTTKIVTALTVLNNCENINKEIEINPKAVGISGTSIYLKYGEKLTIKELLYGMMLPSGNDAATALAYHVGNDIPNFCKMMEDTVSRVGAVSSSFTNPHGLDEAGHYTTAHDLALITAKALENDTFKEIVTTKNMRIRGSSPNTYRYLKNKNRLLNTLDGCIGVKTGYTGKAGRCLVSACERNGVKRVCVVLNCNPMFEESFDLLNASYDNYTNLTLLPSYKIVRKIAVCNGRSESVKLFTRKEFSYPLTDAESGRIQFIYNLPNSLTAPVKKDEHVGEIEIYLDNHLLFSEKIYTMDSVKKIGVWSNIQDIISEW